MTTSGKESLDRPVSSSSPPRRRLPSWWMILLNAALFALLAWRVSANRDYWSAAREQKTVFPLENPPVLMRQTDD
jgi:hypothetical protein